MSVNAPICKDVAMNLACVFCVFIAVCNRKSLLKQPEQINEARFDIVRKYLNAENQRRWDSFSQEKKCMFISKLIEKEMMV